MVLPEPSEPVIIFCSLTPASDSMVTMMFFIAPPVEESTTLIVKGSSSSWASTVATIEMAIAINAKMKIRG